MNAPTRVLSFPPDRVVGRLVSGKDQTPIPATGEVVVGRDAELTLLVGGFDPSDPPVPLEFLERLAANDLQGLWVAAGATGQLVHAAHLTGLRQMSISADLDPIDWRHLTGLVGLGHLVLAGSVTGLPLADLKGCSLTTLWLMHEDTVTDDCWKPLSELGGLTSLYLSGSDVTGRGLGLLSAIPFLASVHVTSPALGNSVLDELEQLPALRELTLNGGQLDDRFLARLAAGALPHLRAFTVANPIQDAAISGAALTQLRLARADLLVNGTELSPAARKKLARPAGATT